MFSLNRHEALELASEEGMVIVDGFDEAIIGVSSRCGENTIIAYNIDKIIHILIDRDGFSFNEANDYVEYNIIGQYVGESTPCFIRLIDDEE